MILYTVSQHRANHVSRLVVEPLPFRQPIYKFAIIFTAVDYEQIEFQSSDKLELVRLPKEMEK